MSAILSAALRQRGLVLILFVMMMGAGLAAFRELNIEAYPDPVPPLVDIVTQSTGQSAEEIERNITIPIEVQMSGIPHVTAIRSISLFGLSDVKVQFTYGFTYDEAEQRVINRLSQLQSLPGSAQPQISPVSPIGEIFRYRLNGPKGFSVAELKTIQDWTLQRRLKAVPGVIDVTAWGGTLKTYDINIDLDKLTSYGLTLPQMLQSLSNSNINVGAQTVNLGAQSVVVRGIGLVRSMDDIRNTVLSSTNGSPVFVRDVAQVSPGFVPRLGIAGQDADNDIVEGIVLMRRGEASTLTIKKVEDEIAYINSHDILPPGVDGRADLRPPRPDQHHDIDRVSQRGVRYRADLPDPMDFSSRLAKRADSRLQHPLRAVLCGHYHGSTRRAGQSAFGRRHRFRADRRCFRHHDGEHLPPSARRQPA